MNQRVILASGSAQRKAMFSVLNVPFESIPADIDEKSIRFSDFKKQAETIARAKAEKVASEHDAIVISADTFVGMGDKTLEKPETKEEALQMLREQSGKEIQIYTGCCYLDRANQIDASTAIVVRARVRDLSEEEMKAYVEKFPVTSWSGAFSPAYPYGLAMLASAEGSVTGYTHGLPVEFIAPLLKKSGIPVMP